MTEIKKNLEDFRVNILLTILLISLYYLVIYVAFLFWDGISIFCVFRFCVCFFFVLAMLRRIDVIFNERKLLIQPVGD